MEPTLDVGDRVLVNKLSYDLHDINRGDIVVFELPEDQVGPDGIKDLIKRVIGLPGPVIATHAGGVYIDARRLDDTCLPDVGPPGTSFPLQNIPEDSAFEHSTNRAISPDNPPPLHHPSNTVR